MVVTQTIQLRTRGGGDTHDITGQVAGAVQGSDLKDGIVTIFVRGSTGALSTVEYEPGLVADLGDYFDRAVPPDIPYQHDRRGALCRRPPDAGHVAADHLCRL
jgi:thiamine phosphate synthase YjbQ (UPF0047 family)